MESAASLESSKCGPGVGPYPLTGHAFSTVCALFGISRWNRWSNFGILLQLMTCRIKYSSARGTDLRPSCTDKNYCVQWRQSFGCACHPVIMTCHPAVTEWTRLLHSVCSYFYEHDDNLAPFTLQLRFTGLEMVDRDNEVDRLRWSRFWVIAMHPSSHQYNVPFTAMLRLIEHALQ